MSSDSESSNCSNGFEEDEEVASYPLDKSKAIRPAKKISKQSKSSKRKDRKAIKAQLPDDPIWVVDINESFYESSPRNWKRIECSDAFEEQPNYLISRYEVLKDRYRRFYFDVENVPKDAPETVDNFIKLFNDFLIKASYIAEPMNYVKTLNVGSVNHEGLSYHVICYEYSADFIHQKAAVQAFLDSEEGKQFEPYIDTSVYSKNRLFKLPYFVGIPKAEDNYHAFACDDHDHEHYVIQHTINTEELILHYKLVKGKEGFSGPSREEKKLNKKIEKVLKAVNAKVMTIGDAVSDSVNAGIFANIQPGTKKPDDLIAQLTQLLSIERLNERDKTKIENSINKIKQGDCNLDVIDASIKMIKRKYK